MTTTCAACPRVVEVSPALAELVELLHPRALLCRECWAAAREAES